ncbi:MAG: hypothetical protein ACR2OR_16345 [Hyphomicrobiales bacterium]
MNKTQTNTPSATASDDRFRERFHYWKGLSGRRYIFSVYNPKACPPLPGAVYIAVARDGAGTRTARAIGRFARFWEAGSGNAAAMAREAGASEIHVHLLAEDDGAADATVADLKAAFAPAVVMREHHVTKRRWPTPVRARKVPSCSPESVQADLFAGARAAGR